MVETKAGRGVLIRYARVGARTRVRHAVFDPVGQQDLYRLNAIVSDKLLPKYESIVMHMIQSFMARPEPSSRRPSLLAA